MSSHDEFLELCAVSTSGQLTAQEQTRLQEHLAGCASCREALKQYEAIVSKTIPELAATHASEPNPQDSSWSLEQSEADLFQRLALEEGPRMDSGSGRGDDASETIGRIPPFASEATWRNVWMLYAAGILLTVALGVCTYRIGIQRGSARVATATAPQSQSDSVLEQQVSDAAHEREVLRAQMGQRDKLITDLRHQLERQSSEVGRVKEVQDRLRDELQTGQVDSQSLAQQRDDLGQKLAAAQSQAQALQTKLDLLQQQSSDDRLRTIALDSKVTELTHSLRERDETIDKQQELLAHDRDVRELIGARDLYMAEVFDVDRDGETRKPTGRVFFTKEKSLIFYAYDLDQQKGVKNASFQAWGKRGPDWQQAINLGIFYVDNAAKKRWILKFDNPKSLAQIDAVFVTVEPNGGSRKPSTKPLLFAYLRMEPNHP
jgi:hypothetical protein